MSVMVMAYDDAKEAARERMEEVLEMVVPGFRPERAFRCLSPDHEDRHPSMRYLSRTKTVRCFSCGWHGDVFTVVSAVYGLPIGEAFAKTYAILGIESKGGIVRMTKRKPTNPTPRCMMEIIATIYPLGWDTVEEIVLPMPLQVVDELESGIVGCLLVRQENILECVEAGLHADHFEDSELGGLYNALAVASPLDDYSPDYIGWLKSRAVPVHMVRRSAELIVETGNRRLLDAVFVKAYSHFQNREPASRILTDMLRRCSVITGKRYCPPGIAEQYLEGLISTLFTRHNKGDMPDVILSSLCHSEKVTV